jgi:hypothetical protein
VKTPIKLVPQANIFGLQSPTKAAQETTGKKRRRRANNFMEANKDKIEKMDVNFLLEASEQKAQNLLASGKNNEDSLRQVYCELNNSVPFNFKDHNVGKVLGRRLNEFINFESQEKYFKWQTELADPQKSKSDLSELIETIKFQKDSLLMLFYCLDVFLIQANARYTDLVFGKSPTKDFQDAPRAEASNPNLGSQVIINNNIQVNQNIKINSGNGNNSGNNIKCTKTKKHPKTRLNEILKGKSKKKSAPRQDSQTSGGEPTSKEFHLEHSFCDSKNNKRTLKKMIKSLTKDFTTSPNREATKPANRSLDIPNEKNKRLLHAKPTKLNSKNSLNNKSDEFFDKNFYNKFCKKGFYPRNRSNFKTQSEILYGGSEILDTSEIDKKNSWHDINGHIRDYTQYADQQIHFLKSQQSINEGPGLNLDHMDASGGQGLTSDKIVEFKADSNNYDNPISFTFRKPDSKETKRYQVVGSKDNEIHDFTLGKGPMNSDGSGSGHAKGGDDKIPKRYHGLIINGLRRDKVKWNLHNCHKFNSIDHRQGVSENERFLGYMHSMGSGEGRNIFKTE